MSALVVRFNVSRDWFELAESKRLSEGGEKFVGVVVSVVLNYLLIAKNYLCDCKRN